MVDQDINFQLNLADNISATLNRVEKSVGELDNKIQGLHTSTVAQNVSFLAQVSAVRSVDMGFRGLVNVGTELGLVSGKLQRSLNSVSTAVHGVSSAFQLLKGARQILLMLQSAEVGVATVEAFRAGLKGKMGLVILGISTAAATGGYFVGKSSVNNETNVSQNITFSGTDAASERSMAESVLRVVGG